MVSGLEGYVPHPPAATAHIWIQDSLAHKEKEHIKQLTHVSSCVGHSPGMRASKFLAHLHLICYILTSTALSELQRKEVLVMELKPRSILRQYMLPPGEWHVLDRAAQCQSILSPQADILSGAWIDLDLFMEIPMSCKKNNPATLYC